MKNQKSEELQYLDPKTMWLFFIKNLTVFLLIAPLYLFGISVAVLTFLSGQNINQPEERAKTILEFLLGGIGISYLLIAFTFSFILAYLTYKNWRYGLTPDALRIEKGIIWKRYVSIPYERIQNVDILRGILARLLGLSDIQVQTAGSSYGPGFSAFSEGRLPGLNVETAKKFRDELIKKSKGKSGI